MRDVSLSDLPIPHGINYFWVFLRYPHCGFTFGCLCIEQGVYLVFGKKLSDFNRFSGRLKHTPSHEGLFLTKNVCQVQNSSTCCVRHFRGAIRIDEVVPNWNK